MLHFQWCIILHSTLKFYWFGFNFVEKIQEVVLSLDTKSYHLAILLKFSFFGLIELHFVLCTKYVWLSYIWANTSLIWEKGL